MLDDKIKESFNELNFKNQFFCYKLAKTDKYKNDNNTKIPMGVDGINQINFEEHIETISRHACKRVIEGKYFFSPFREIEISKLPGVKLKQARELEQIRTLSIATIKDVVVQKIFYNAIEDYCEKKFDELKPEVSFAYRRGKSAPKAAKKIYEAISKQGYVYCLDADIKSFFDEIPHDKLLIKIEQFFGEENILTIKYLKRFFSADKVKYDDYYGNVDKYYNNKPKRIKRSSGIPQGGVLSGLVANIYMHDFDTYMVKNLYSKYNYDIKYFRYADDFVILSKKENIINDIFKDIQVYLHNEGLTIHEIGKKTNKINMSESCREKLEFLGFKISPKNLSIKKSNIKKFQSKIDEKINQTIIYKNNPHKGLEIMIKKIRFKILGNLEFTPSLSICEKCHKDLPRRNWLSYFIVITDVRILRYLDIWIRKKIYESYYKKTKKRLSKRILIQYEIPQLEQLYYQYKKESALKIDYCNCLRNLEDESIN